MAFACRPAAGVPPDLLLTGGTDEVVISYQPSIWLVMTPAAFLAGVLLGLMGADGGDVRGDGGLGPAGNPGEALSVCVCSPSSGCG